MEPAAIVQDQLPAYEDAQDEVADVKVEEEEPDLEVEEVFPERRDPVKAAVRGVPVGARADGDAPHHVIDVDDDDESDEEEEEEVDGPGARLQAVRARVSAARATRRLERAFVSLPATDRYIVLTFSQSLGLSEASAVNTRNMWPMSTSRSAICSGAFLVDFITSTLRIETMPICVLG